MTFLLTRLQNLLDQTRVVDFLAPLLLRAYLAPILWLAGINKFRNFDSTVQWLGEAGLDLPLPWLMAFLATATELAGAVALLLGAAVRWMAVPLMITMIVAAVTVHSQHGWQTIADPVFCLFNCADAEAATTRLDRAEAILRKHGDYEWLTEQGSFVVLNNGIQMAATYFIMLLVLFFQGGGRFVSVDDWIRSRAMKRA